MNFILVSFSLFLKCEISDTTSEIITGQIFPELYLRNDRPMTDRNMLKYDQLKYDHLYFSSFWYKKDCIH